MAELALEAFGALAMTEELADYRLGVHTCRGGGGRDIRLGGPHLQGRGGGRGAGML